jgi:hypothetical protein
MRSLALISFLALAGCYPALRTIQPEADVHVLTADGLPIQGAEVHIYSISNPHARMENHVVSWSDENGVARFGRIKDWKLDAPLIMHGLMVMHWNICASSQGLGSSALYRLNKWEAGGKVSLVIDEASDGEEPSCESFLTSR